MRKLTFASALICALALLAAPAAADSHAPSSNDANRGNGWAHFNVLDDTRIGAVDLELVSTRPFVSCFEYRSDGQDTQDPRANFNPDVEDGLWPFTCVDDSTVELTLEAQEYVEVRMVFGGESDERFEWTRVEVRPDARTKDDCKNGGWAEYGFDNQGQCIRFVNTGKDSRG